MRVWRHLGEIFDFDPNSDSKLIVFATSLFKKILELVHDPKVFEIQNAQYFFYFLVYFQPIVETFYQEKPALVLSTIKAMFEHAKNTAEKIEFWRKGFEAYIAIKDKGCSYTTMLFNYLVGIYFQCFDNVLLRQFISINLIHGNCVNKYVIDSMAHFYFKKLSTYSRNVSWMNEDVMMMHTVFSNLVLQKKFHTQILYFFLDILEIQSYKLILILDMMADFVGRCVESDEKMDPRVKKFFDAYFDSLWKTSKKILATNHKMERSTMLRDNFSLSRFIQALTISNPIYANFFYKTVQKIESDMIFYASSRECQNQLYDPPKLFLLLSTAIGFPAKIKAAIDIGAQPRLSAEIEPPKESALFTKKGFITNEAVKTEEVDEEENGYENILGENNEVDVEIADPLGETIQIYSYEEQAQNNIKKKGMQTRSLTSHLTLNSCISPEMYDSGGFDEISEEQTYITPKPEIKIAPFVPELVPELPKVQPVHHQHACYLREVARKTFLKQKEKKKEFVKSHPVYVFGLNTKLLNEDPDLSENLKQNTKNYRLLVRFVVYDNLSEKEKQISNEITEFYAPVLKKTFGNFCIKEEGESYTSPKHFLAMLRSFNFHHLTRKTTMSSIISIFKLINYSFLNNRKESLVLNFDGFIEAIRQFSYLVFTDYDPSITSADSLCLFFEQLKELSKDPFSFENPQVLTKNTDRELIETFTPYLLKGKRKLIPSVLKIEKMHIWTLPESEESKPSEKVSIARSIVIDLIHAIFGCDMGVSRARPKSSTLLTFDQSKLTVLLPKLRVEQFKSYSLNTRLALLAAPPAKVDLMLEVAETMDFLLRKASVIHPGGVVDETQGFKIINPIELKRLEELRKEEEAARAEQEAFKRRKQHLSQIQAEMQAQPKQIIEQTNNSSKENELRTKQYIESIKLKANQFKIQKQKKREEELQMRRELEKSARKKQKQEFRIFNETRVNTMQKNFAEISQKLKEQTGTVAIDRYPKPQIAFTKEELEAQKVLHGKTRELIGDALFHQVFRANINFWLDIFNSILSILKRPDSDFDSSGESWGVAHFHQFFLRFLPPELRKTQKSSKILYFAAQKVCQKEQFDIGVLEACLVMVCLGSLGLENSLPLNEEQLLQLSKEYEKHFDVQASGNYLKKAYDDMVQQHNKYII